jgi:phage gp36-like protein
MKMTELGQKERCEQAMLKVMKEFEKRGIRQVEKNTLIAAAQIVSQMEVDQGLLNLVYAGEVRLGFDSNGEIEISNK